MSGPSMALRIADYVRRQGSCEPGDPVLVDNDPTCPVWKVPVLRFNDDWTVPPPRFWYVCPRPGMNLYRDDHQRPAPWLPAGEQDEADVLDYLKSFHLGVTGRLTSSRSTALDPAALLDKAVRR